MHRRPPQKWIASGAGESMHGRMTSHALNREKFKQNSTWKMSKDWLMRRRRRNLKVISTFQTVQSSPVTFSIERIQSWIFNQSVTFIQSWTFKQSVTFIQSWTFKQSGTFIQSWTFKQSCTFIQSFTFNQPCTSIQYHSIMHFQLALGLSRSVLECDLRPLSQSSTINQSSFLDKEQYKYFQLTKI